MAANPDDAFDWTVRSFIYAHIVEHERPPTAAETAPGLRVGKEGAPAAYPRLDRRHALFLQPGGDTIRMAHPFSSVPTPFHVHANGHAYAANYAWDALSIPAALHAEATVEAIFADDGSPTTIAIVRDGPRHRGEVIHCSVPFAAWYDDLILT